MPQPGLRTFLTAARDQAAELRRRVTARLMVSRRHQFAVSLAFALVAGFMVSSAVSGARHAESVWSTCPTVAPTTVPLAPDDWRVVALPRDMVAPDVDPGDLVDLVSQSVLVAGRAIVTSSATETHGVNVAVAPESAPLVATAAQSGDISLVALSTG